MLCTRHQVHSGQKIDTNQKGGACRKYGDRRGAYMVLVGKPEGSRPLERPKHGWEDIKLDLLEIRWMGGMDRIYLAEDKESWWALQNTVMNRQVP